MRLRVRFDFIDGSSETHDAEEVSVKLFDRDEITCFSGKEDFFEKRVDEALARGGIFEVPPLPNCSLIEKIKISSHAVKKVVFIKNEDKSKK